MIPHGKNFIGDELTAGSGEAFRAISPLDSTPLEPAFQAAGLAEVDTVMRLAEAAFTTYRETTGEQRRSSSSV